MDPRWRGSQEVTESPDSPDYGYEAGKVTCSRVFFGPYGKCVAARPVRGSTMEDVDPALVVETARVKRMPGGKGQLTVLLQSLEEVTADGAEDGPPMYEVEWAQLEKPLLRHPRYLVGGGKALTDTDLAALKAWEDESDVVAKAAYKYRATKDAEPTSVLSANAQDYAAKRLRGQEAYTIHVPVVRRTRETRAAYTEGTCDKQWTAAQLKSYLGIDVPEDIGGDAVVYLKTADRSTRSGRVGRWERSEEWTGAHEWDADLYEAYT